MKKIFAISLVVFFCMTFAVSALAEDYTLDANGNAVFTTAVGYTFKIDDVNGQITGEDATVLTSAEGLANCGSWSMWFVADRVSDNVYVAATNGTAMGGNSPSIDLKDGQIIVVIHSASSRPADAATYTNWEACAVAAAVKTGDYLVLSGIDLAAGTCTDGTIKVTTKEEAGVEGETSTPDESSAASSEAESSEASSEADASSEAITESSVESSVDSSADESVDGEEGGLGAMLWVIIGVAVVVVVAVIAVVLKKKK